MSISQALLSLASKLKEQSDDVLAQAEHNPALFNYTMDVIASALHDLELGAKLIDGVEPQVTPEMLETVAGLAEALDETDDEVLVKRASMLDELLVTISAPKSAVAQAAAKTEDQINELRNKYRAQRVGELYSNPQKVLNQQINHEQVAKAVKEQVKEYRPMEAPLMTRYCPDHNGAMMSRIADRVYQCPMDRKVYNYESGYTTEKGNKIPGGGVENQVPDWGHRDIGSTVFDSRQSSLNRFAQAAPKYTVREHAGTQALDVTVPVGTTADQKKTIQREIANTYGQMAIWWHEGLGSTAQALPKHTVSLPAGGGHELVISIPPNTTEAQKQQIQQSIVNTYGTQYTIKWNPTLVNQASVKKNATKHGDDLNYIPFDLNEEEAEGLRYIADSYDSGKILYDNWDQENKTLSFEGVIDAFMATKGDGGNLGTVPLAGGSLNDKIMRAFDAVDAWEQEYASEEERHGGAWRSPEDPLRYEGQTDDDFEDEENRVEDKVEAMAHVFMSKLANGK